MIVNISGLGAFQRFSGIRNTDPAKKKTGVGTLKISGGISGETSESRDAVRVKVGGAIHKLKLGRRLSPAEMSALRENSPVYYQKAVMIRAEREQYRRRLYACRSKREVQRVRENKQQEHLLAADAAEKSGQGKEEALEFVGMRRAAAESEHAEFKKSVRYIRLPEKTKTPLKKRRAVDSYV